MFAFTEAKVVGGGGYYHSGEEGYITGKEGVRFHAQSMADLAKKAHMSDSSENTLNRQDKLTYPWHSLCWSNSKI